MAESSRLGSSPSRLRRHTTPTTSRPQPPQRAASQAPSDSDDSASLLEGGHDDETGFFIAQANDSQSSLGVTNLRDMSLGTDLARQRRVSPVSRLPPELLIAIFTKLSSTADLRNCMLVSYSWAMHCVGVLWHRPQCNVWKNVNNITTSLSQNPFFRYHEMVKRLNLATLHDKVNDGTIQPFQHCKRIERLTLTKCSNLTDSGLAGLLEGNKHLQALDVTDIVSLTDHTLHAVARNCPRLQGLNVTNCIKLTDESLVMVAAHCRQVKRLKFNNLSSITDESVTAFAHNCPSILEIDLDSCTSITSDSVTALLSSLCYLRELRLAHCVSISDSAFLNLPPRLNFEYLRILDLTGCENVRDESLCRIIPATPKLRNLVLNKCKYITDRSAYAICLLGKTLHYLHLGHCVNLTDQAVVGLVKSCNRIRYIDLACCHRLTDQSVQHLAQLPKLRRIGLVKCQQLTDQSILALARGSAMSSAPSLPRPTCLERVHLSYCVSLTLQGVQELLQYCPRLTHLSLTGVQAFLREDLTRFCRDPPPEFTPAQREVFCVFSGEGVSRLRDYLKRLAEEYERQGRMSTNESPATSEPEMDSSRETLSEDGTVDGADERAEGSNTIRPESAGQLSTPPMFMDSSQPRHPTHSLSIARPRSGVMQPTCTSNFDLPGLLPDSGASLSGRNQVDSHHLRDTLMRRRMSEGSETLGRNRSVFLEPVDVEQQMQSGAAAERPHQLPPQLEGLSVQETRSMSHGVIPPPTTPWRQSFASPSWHHLDSRSVEPPFTQPRLFPPPSTLHRGSSNDADEREDEVIR